MQGQEVNSGGQLLFKVKANTSEVDVIDVHVGQRGSRGTGKDGY